MLARALVSLRCPSPPDARVSEVDGAAGRGGGGSGVDAKGPKTTAPFSPAQTRLLTAQGHTVWRLSLVPRGRRKQKSLVQCRHQGYGLWNLAASARGLNNEAKAAESNPHGHTGR